MKQLIIPFGLLVFLMLVSCLGESKPLEAFEDIPDTGLVFESCLGLDCTVEALDLELDKLIEIKALQYVKLSPYETAN